MSPVGSDFVCSRFTVTDWTLPQVDRVSDMEGLVGQGWFLPRIPSSPVRDLSFPVVVPEVTVFLGAPRSRPVFGHTFVFFGQVRRDSERGDRRRHKGAGSGVGSDGRTGGGPESRLDKCHKGILEGFP